MDAHCFCLEGRNLHRCRKGVVLALGDSTANVLIDLGFVALEKIMLQAVAAKPLHPHIPTTMSNAGFFALQKTECKHAVCVGQ